MAKRPTKKHRLVPWRWSAPALLLALLLMLLSSQAVAQAPTPVSACGTVTGSVILTTDLTGSGTCLTVGADNTTIDGNGH
ncbi:MAG: hypothetical protein HY975_01620, partial [Candidatus Kerfeldbacteria bacterium]|nr:hypothetical protein [Candidatus Kerfeldbacteria bacterium]